jgi:23S rRNA pseudouridine2605 synthase
MTAPDARETGDGRGGERVAKVIARAGLCSRRDAERLIAAGRVAVNGRTLESPAVTVAPDDRVTVDGEALPAAEPPRLWRYHKPRGQVTAARDPQGRPTVFDALPAGLPRLMPVGRLDINSEGLLLLTNDGALKRRLELPRTGWVRRYRVRVHGTPDPAALAALAQGISVAGVAYGPIRAAVERRTGRNAWLSVALAEGKNREVRRVLEHLGLTVNRLIRVSYGPFQLGRLPPGGIAEVPRKVLAEQLGSDRTPAAAGDESAGKRKPGAGWAKARARTKRPGAGRRSEAPSGKAKGRAHRRRPS